MVARALLSLLIMGCASAELAPPVYTALRGPAAERKVKRLVALPATCGTLSTVTVKSGEGYAAIPAECPTQSLPAVNQMIRSQLDFLGFQVIDSDKVNAVTASRHEVEVRNKYQTTTSTETHGSLFDDATPAEQADILRELGADALLSTRVFVGPGSGFSRRRTVVVQVRLRTASDGTMIWAHRCEVEIAGVAFDIDGIQEAARCAMGKAP